jgi:hypothetical protein
MADATKKEIKALVKEQTRDALQKAKEVKAKLAGKSKMHPVLGAGIALASAAACSYADGRVGGDSKHTASYLVMGAGILGTIVAEVADKPSLAHAAADVTVGPAIWVLASHLNKKGVEHANAPKTTKAPATAQAAG